MLGSVFASVMNKRPCCATFDLLGELPDLSGLFTAKHVHRHKGQQGPSKAAPSSSGCVDLLDLKTQARFKSSKFEIRPDEVQQLEMDLGTLTAPGLKANMFAKDFKKQVLAADALKAWIISRGDEVRTSAGSWDDG